jgi:tetratricopeptide (TPR) repeat protein
MQALGAIGIVGGIIMIFAGVDMARIVSQSAAEGGTRSVAEVFYNAMGWGFIGLGIFCIMLICVVAFKKVQPAEGDRKKEEGRMKERIEEGERRMEERIEEKERRKEQDRKENADTYYRAGEGYYKMEKYDKAIAYYDKAIELNPNHALAYYNRGGAYAEIRQYKKAIADYDRAIELNPNNALAYYNRGGAYSEIGENEKAIAGYDRAIELDPDDADAYYNRGLTYQAKGEVTKAVGDLEMCIGLSTDPEVTEAAQQALREAKKSP